MSELVQFQAAISPKRNREEYGPEEDNGKSPLIVETKELLDRVDDTDV